jgi:AcrR family transcriptional regulator
MVQKDVAAAVKRGRPRAFDWVEALRRAMNLFWERGYEGTFVADLTQAMSINKPSLYAAFGCKAAVFREAVALYDAVEGEPVQQALDKEPTARAAVEAVPRHNAQAYADPTKPRGCMVVLSSLLGAVESLEVREFLKESRKHGEASLRCRIERGIIDGDLPSTADAAKLAAFVRTVMHGLSVQARDGAACAELDTIVNCAMAGWDALTAPELVRLSGRASHLRPP